MFVGVGASRVRDLFAEARKRAPAIIFVDEIDAIGRRRGRRDWSQRRTGADAQPAARRNGRIRPGNRHRRPRGDNRPEVLDPALLRPGRFDRQVIIPLPTLRERVAILEVHARGKQLAPDVSLEVVARGTPGFSGADLANLVNEAAIIAVRADRVVLQAGDLISPRPRHSGPARGLERADER